MLLSEQQRLLESSAGQIDLRTPFASIVGPSWSLRDRGERMDAAARAGGAYPSPTAK